MLLIFAAAFLVVVLVAATTFVVWNRNYRTAGAENPGTNCPMVVKARHRLPLTSVGVHRVALIGDSLMSQPSCAIADGLAQVGVTTTRHAVPGSGLLTGSVDWVAQTRLIMQREHPDVVVAIFVGNYPEPFVRDESGDAIRPDTPAFFAAWQARAVALSDVVRSFRVPLYWVSPPPIDLQPFRRAQRLYAGYRTITKDHFLDSGKSLAGSHGEEVGEKETCHRRRVVRSADTVHLTDDGARIYGQQIAHDLTARVGLLTSPRPC